MFKAVKTSLPYLNILLAVKSHFRSISQPGNHVLLFLAPPGQLFTLLEGRKGRAVKHNGGPGGGGAAGRWDDETFLVAICKGLRNE